MRKLCVAFVFLMLFGAVAAQAEGYCVGCYWWDETFSECTSYNGRWTNCSVVCDQFACSCHMSTTGGTCTRDPDGLYSYKTYYRIRYVRPVSIDSQFTIISVEVKPAIRRSRV